MAYKPERGCLDENNQNNNHNFIPIIIIIIMSEQQTPKSPVLCKMGCGFFGSDATGNCCSKCWMDSLKKQNNAPPPSKPQPKAIREEAPEPMEICEEIMSAPVPSAAVVEDAASTSAKKKKKRTSYKAMMAGMMTAQNADSKAEKEREALKKGLGGGAFTKVEKI